VSNWRANNLIPFAAGRILQKEVAANGGKADLGLFGFPVGIVPERAA
jgi:hypothetical protein